MMGISFIPCILKREAYIGKDEPACTRLAETVVWRGFRGGFKCCGLCPIRKCE